MVDKKGVFRNRCHRLPSKLSKTSNLCLKYNGGLVPARLRVWFDLSMCCFCFLGGVVLFWFSVCSPYPVRVSVLPQVILSKPVDLICPVLDWISFLQRQRLGSKGCVAGKWDVLGTQQDVDGVATLCAFMVADCWAARPTVPYVCSFVASYHAVPAIFCQLTPSAGAPKILSSPGKAGGSNVCGHIGPRAIISQGTGFCYLFIIFKPMGATLFFVLLWRQQDSTAFLCS